MSSKLKQFFHADEGFAGVTKSVNLFSTRTDTEIAVLGPAYLDKALRHALRTKLITTLSVDEEAALYGFPGPLSSFSGKISLAYALGVFSKEVSSDLKKIKDVRNVFAHASFPISFETKEIVQDCASFQILRTLKAQTGPQVMDDLEPFETLATTFNVDGIDIALADHWVLLSKDRRILCYVPSSPLTPSATTREKFVRAVQLIWWLLMSVGAVEHGNSADAYKNKAAPLSTTF